MQHHNRLRDGFLAAVILLFSMSPVWAEPLELSLEDSVSLAIRNNPAIKMAAAAREQSVWAQEQASADKKLNVGYSFIGERSDKAPSFEPSMAPVSTYSYSSHEIKLTLPVYTGGKLEGKMKEAELSTGAAEQNVEQVRQQLRLDTTTAYYHILAASNLLGVAKQTVQDFSVHLDNVRHMYDVGSVAMADVLQTKVKLAKAQDGLIKAQNRYDLAVYQFNNLVGLPLQNDTHLKESLEYQPASLNLDDSIKLALRQRPEIAAAQAEIAIARERVKIAASEKRPTVNLVGVKDWQDIEFPGIANSSWTVLVRADINLFDAGHVDAQVKKADYAVTVAAERARQLSDNIALEVSHAYKDVNEAEKRIATDKVTVEQAELDFKIAQERYEAGMSINLDVLDAELALDEARTDYIQALYDYNVGRARLAKAMGVKCK